MDLEWCLNGCGKKPKSDMLFCSSTCFSSAQITFHNNNVLMGHKYHDRQQCHYEHINANLQNYNKGGGLYVFTNEPRSENKFTCQSHDSLASMTSKSSKLSKGKHKRLPKIHPTLLASSILTLNNESFVKVQHPSIQGSCLSSFNTNVIHKTANLKQHLTMTMTAFTYIPSTSYTTFAVMTGAITSATTTKTEREVNAAIDGVYTNTMMLQDNIVLADNEFTCPSLVQMDSSCPTTPLIDLQNTFSNNVDNINDRKNNYIISSSWNSS